VKIVANEEIRATQKLMVDIAQGSYTNAMVESALYNMAVGYKTEEKKEVYKKGQLAETIIITREVTPDLNAIKVWLYNRCPEKWKEKIIDGEEAVKKIDKILAEINKIASEE
jgi:hypothetical protein